MSHLGTEGATVSMMATKKLLVKDSSNTFNDKLVTFAADVPEDVLCACCWNISSQLMADPRDHLYCKSCLAMLDNDGKFDCVTDYAVHNIDEMKDRSERFREALKLIANCPNEGCNYRATLREIMTHYKTCVVKMAKCPLCQKEVNKKALAAHISSVCEHRLVNCPYCGMEVEDRHLKNHMQDCDERPATCPHCAEEFDTFAELRDEHLPTCRSKPTNCPYARVGCNFQATANMMEKHASSCQHLSSLIDRVLHLEAELQDVKSALEEAKKDKEQLKQLIADKEDEYHKTDEYLRKNLQEDIDEVRTQVQKVERDYKTSESDLRARFQALEQRNTFLEEPIGKLLAEMATMN
ncbi:TNF receptor-associated factor 3 isoform X4 [Rhipicephalus microplus]|uniref:TNF receptor-associated factor 3 isoform X4 n=1 Tax=Rhipicephalus microplus TaxID=6941 RepID=UPI003F6B08AB